MEQFKMDRTTTTKSTFLEANDHTTYFINKSPIDRLNHACYIINTIFNSKLDQKVNKKVTFSRKHA
jgi:hypothetical protein